MLKGAVVGLVLALISIAAAFLFKVLPANQRKSAAVALILVGIVSMLTNLPYSWGMLDQNNAADILFISLLFGGGFLSIVGVFLLRMNRESNEGSNGKEVPSPFNFKWLIGSCIFSLLSVAALFGFVIPRLADEVAEVPKVPAVSPQQANQRFELAKPNSIDEALGYLQNGLSDKRDLAIEFLTREENVDPKLQTTVCNALLKHPRYSAAALRQWAHPELGPILKSEIEKPNGYVNCESLLELYVDLAGAEAGLALIPHIEDPFSTSFAPVLKKIGPAAMDLIVPFMNSHQNYLPARKLLDQWNADGNLLVSQCLEDLDSTESSTSNRALKFLQGFSGDINDDVKGQLASQMEQQLLSPDGKGRKEALEILTKYPSENTSTALFDFLKRSRKSAFDAEILKGLFKLDDEISIDAAVFSLFDYRGSTKDSAKFLLERGSETVARKMIEHFDAATRRSQVEAAKIIQQMDNGEPLLITKSVSYLESANDEFVRAAMSILSGIKSDPDHKQDVANAMAKAIDSIDASTESQAVMKKVCDAAGIWGDSEVASRLGKFVDAPNQSVQRMIRSARKKIEEREGSK